MKSSVIYGITLATMLAASTANAQDEPKFDPGIFAIVIVPLIAALKLGQEAGERFEAGCLERGGEYVVTNLTYDNQWGCVGGVARAQG